MRTPTLLAARTPFDLPFSLRPALLPFLAPSQLPDELFLLKQLQRLLLGGNALKELPQSIGQLSALQARARAARAESSS